MGMSIGSGSTELIRASLVRALMASAVIAGALTLAGCYTDVGYQLPTRAMKELSPEMLALLQKKDMPKESPILIRIFKEESELEVWKQDTSGRYELLKVYPICRWSGGLGPKVKEGDRQAPEGFYSITPGLMNPNSSYYLAINTGFPNAFDKANGYSGAFLMIHGDCSSRGCYAMTDEQIGEIYSLAREAFLGGQKEFQIQAYPFRMTPANLARHRNNPNLAFWKMIKVGNDHFEVSHLEPKVDVCERHYVFDAVPPASSTKPLVFNPTGRCPAFDINPQIAEAAAEKQRNDEYQLAELISRDVPVAPLNTNTDGGMNRVFVAKLENPTYTYDNNGHIHVPPVQPGRLPPEISPPPGANSDATPGLASPGGTSMGGLLKGLFASNGAAASPPAATASAEPQSHTGLLGSLFGTKHENAQTAAAEAADPEQTATTAALHAKSKSAKHGESAIADLRLSKAVIEPHKTEPQSTETARTKSAQAAPALPQPQVQASNASPASNNGLLPGAQPVVPAGSFESRWRTFQ